MRNKLRNEEGLTLVELLAVFVIGIIVMSLVIGVHVAVQKQYNKQKEDISYFLDVTTGAKAITKDIRRAEQVNIINPNKLELEWEDDTGTVQRHYELVNNVVQRDGSDYISEIETFTFDEDVGGLTKITFNIKGQSENEIETEIFLR